MMFRKAYQMVLAVLFLVSLLSCTRERVEGGIVPEGQAVEMTLQIGVSSGAVIEPTKSTHGLDAENRVYNLYVFIFDKDGKKMYGGFFDYTNLSASGVSTLPDWWEVKNNEGSGTSLSTTGTLHIHTISKPNCRVVAIANIDAEMVNISPEQLGIVEKYEDLYGMTASLNQLITSRSGYFPMSGELNQVNTGQEASWGRLKLKRLDAKIQFNVYVDLEDGASPISEFKPLKWEVVNIPRKSYILEHGAYNEGAFDQSKLEDGAVSGEADFFNQGETNFETEVVTSSYYAGSTQRHKFKHGFSFYMMENRKPLRESMPTPLAYAYREKQEKLNSEISGGIAQTTNGAFVYPDEYATYVIITAQVVLEPSSQSAGAEVALNADLRYVIHLGDFSNDKFDDFNVFRNHTYSYDIIIRNVNDIRTEVTNNYVGESLAEKLTEPEPGAAGSVSVAKEEVFQSDAHYSSHVITFHAKHVDAEQVSWVVKTPFNPDGASPVITPEGLEITAGIDYQWVEFRLNDMDSEGIYFDQNRQIYKPISGPYSDGKTMNISNLVHYLKTQKRKLDQGLPNDFDQTRDEHGNPDPKISVTAFVNEYYYEKNPITGEYDPDLWKHFVNQPQRYMYILSETQRSADRESKVIGASFTIQQNAIQSIYNVHNADLQSAWGGEHTDDEMERGQETYGSDGDYLGNTSYSNGRLNTLKMWTLYNPNGTNRVLGNEREEDALWSHYMDLTASNQIPVMRSAYQYLRYSCLSRNRDNNGNGVIDLDEVRWYMGSVNQLYGLFLGDYGIEGDARLYQRNAEQRASTARDDWRQHVISSTKNISSSGGNGPTVIWGEEGLSYGSINDSKSWAGGLNTFYTRCLRNLGYDPATGRDITYSEATVEPDEYIQVKRMRRNQEYAGSYDSEVYYEFDCARLNEASLRFYTNRELVSHDEHSEQALLYSYFVTHPKSMSITVKDIPAIQSINRAYSINAYLDSNIGLNPYCPPGYRLPNVRELALMRNFIPSGDVDGFFDKSSTNYTPSRTHWSFGKAGEYYKSNRGTGSRYGWGVTYVKVLMLEDKDEVKQVRCVKDIKQ